MFEVSAGRVLKVPSTDGMFEVGGVWALKVPSTDGMFDHHPRA
jgi:hypothetical protein